MTRLDGKVALVTGGARGIGRAMALRLGHLGAAVAVVTRRLDGLAPRDPDASTPAETVVDELSRGGAASLGVEGDLADARVAVHAVERVLERFGRLDVVVCNAGGGSGPLTGGRASTVGWELVEATMRTNLATAINVCTAAVPSLRQQRAGTIVTVVSRAAVVPGAGGVYSHYGMAKAAVVAYTRSLAAELGPYGIRVNALMPGPTPTERMAPLLEEVGGDRLAHAVPMRRLGTVDDCADVLELLVSDLARFVTGQVVSCDGGLLQGPR